MRLTFHEQLLLLFPPSLLVRVHAEVDQNTRKPPQQVGIIWRLYQLKLEFLGQSTADIFTLKRGLSKFIEVLYAVS